MDNQRTKICICYLITSILISAFIYGLISSNLQSSKQLNRLREEVDEIAHVVLHTPSASGESPKQLTELVDAILKKRLAGIWDDLYTLKKQVKTSECATIGGRRGEGAVGDKLENRVNYASEELGAKIQSVVAVPVASTNPLKSILGLDWSANPPVNMLRQSMEPGNCFAFKNNKSDVVVKLAKEIFIEQIELEHICKALSPTGNTSSAPKGFSVYGIGVDSEVLLGKFAYENSPAKRIQVYPVKTISKFNLVRFKFETNHGNPSYTCVYRIAVYGRMQ